VNQNESNLNQSETLDIQIPSEIKEALDQLIIKNSWEPAEGYVIVVNAGIRFLQDQPQNENNNGIGFPRNPGIVIDHLTKMESLLISMRFRIFELQQANRNLGSTTRMNFDEKDNLLNLIESYMISISELHDELKANQKEIESLKLQNIEKKNEPPSTDAEDGNVNLPDWKTILS